MMDDDTAKELRERIHNLRNKVFWARLEATMGLSLAERAELAAECLDSVEKELAKLEEL